MNDRPAASDPLAAVRRDETLQPLLHAETVLLRAPVQAWSAPDGDMGGAPVHGLYLGDARILSHVALTVGGQRGEPIAHGRRSASAGEHVALLRHLDDADADPRVRLVRRREVDGTSLRETVTLESARTTAVTTVVEVRLRADASVMHVIKAGLVDDVEPRPAITDDGVAWETDGTDARLLAPGAEVAVDGRAVVLRWSVVIPARGRVAVSWSVTAASRTAVVGPATSEPEWAGVRVESGDSRLGRWVATALDDLSGLRMVTTARPDEPFLAAGAPWFFTLFGRDSLWAARMMLPLGTGIAASTLRVLAGLQGAHEDAATAEQPGKIMHELRPGVLTIPGEDVSLPPLYYGTVDATPLWITLLHDAWRAGMPEDEVEALLPHLEAALGWLRDHADQDGDGFLEYRDESGHGLANQGWKDSGDSIQWQDGTLAEGPIALCEVQAYAHEAAVGAAALLERFGRPADEWRAYASAMRERFARAFWIDDGEGGYPAIALDAAKRPVDTLTSNIGHLLGTGILSPEHAARVAELLVSPRLDSGFGLRTLATDAAGYWPLSYHGGSVWTHDTAIAITGLAREGFADEAATLARGLLAAAEDFDHRVPELHSGDAAADVPTAVPYPAACRPQAWSAASAIAVLGVATGGGPAGAAPNAAVAGAVAVHGRA
ncbi:glycogen debranching N-terminal domain-containing protein [Clavibacter sp. MX14-G9D]|uniref:glycogen debranching N-terminal domain-containing protein n=1 Tax=Clavibacter sp. MX14-G9D TaxID=3064656 RepID=UPI00293E5E2D|nr:glycogen debranching N-terminal domain-containing protein [Clavibacter sp. MX14-G9D]